MKLVDKLLLGILVVFIPVGLFLSQWLLTPQQNTTSSEQTTSTSVDVSKLEQLIRQTVSQSVPKQEAPPTFSISSVSYASESGILKIEGTAPQPQGSILVSATLMKNPSDINSLDIDTAIETDLKTGIPVQVYSVQPGENAFFVYEYEVSTENLNSVIELRLDQNLSTKTIRFDLEKKQQVM